jgi:hypothetical protein
MKGMTEYAYDRRISINAGIYLEQETMKAILDLRFNPGEGVAYVQSAAKGLSILCCQSRPNNEMEELKEREIALNATENTRLFDEYLKYVKGATRQPANNFWDLKQNIAAYMALLWVLFGDQCDYYWNIYKIHAIMDLPEVQQLHTKFTPEIVRRITWAIIDDGRSFFNTVLTQQDFNGRGVTVFPHSFLSGVLKNIRFCNPIQRGNFPNKWLGQARNERTPASRGAQPATRGTPLVEEGATVGETPGGAADKVLKWAGVAIHKNGHRRDLGAQHQEEAQGGEVGGGAGHPLHPTPGTQRLQRS